MKNIDIIWFIEHISRELDVACAVGALLERSFGKKIEILPYTINQYKNTHTFNPKLVILPYCYSIKDSGLLNYLSNWPDTLYINIAWEQIFYKANLEYKAPRDIFSKKYVIHHSWSKARSKFLHERGVPKNHIFTNGHPAYKLYERPYKNFFVTRSELAKEFNLDHKKKWIFFPENYSWFFYSNHNLEEIIKNGQNRSVVYSMRDYCSRAFNEVISWINEVSEKNKDTIEIILRPRPAFSITYFKEVLGKLFPRLSRNIHIVKDYSVREWILSSDLVLSSFSTSLIEGAIARKPIYMLEPIPIPPPLVADWYKYVKKVRTKDDLYRVFKEKTQKLVYQKLHDWAKKEFFVKNDPIDGLVEYLGTLKIRQMKEQAEFLKKILDNSSSLKYRLRDTKTQLITALGNVKRRIKQESYYKNDDEDRYLEEIKSKTRTYQNFFKNLS